MQQKGKLDALYNMIIFGSEELQNYNERLEKEVNERQFLNLYLKSIKNNVTVELKGLIHIFSHSAQINIKSYRVGRDADGLKGYAFSTTGCSWTAGKTHSISS